MRVKTICPPPQKKTDYVPEVENGQSVVVHHCPVLQSPCAYRRGNDFCVEEANIDEKNQDNQIQSITLYSTVCIFRKRYTQCTTGSGAKPQKVGNFGEFLC